MDHKAFYPFKVWLSMAVLGSSLFFWGTYIRYIDWQHGILDAIGNYPLPLFISLIVCVPTALALGMSLYLLTKTELSLHWVKALLAFICTTIFLLTLLLIPPFSFAEDGLSMIGCFVIPLIGSIYYYRLA
jgi:hypothetical protein